MGLDWRPADLFEPWGLEADAVLLSRVLHDWDDAAASRILARTRDALPPGGRERSAGEFERLFRATGLELESVRTVAAFPSILVGWRHERRRPARSPVGYGLLIADVGRGFARELGDLLRGRLRTQGRVLWSGASRCPEGDEPRRGSRGVRWHGVPHY